MGSVLLSALIFAGTLSANAQSVKIGSIRINDSIPYSIDLDKLKRSSQIDSITQVPEIMDMSMANGLVYIGGTYFEFFKESNLCRLNVIVLDDKINSISVGAYVLSGTTSLADIKQYFPKDCSSTESVSIYQDPLFYQTCSVPISNAKGEIADMALLFFFSDDKLKRIEIWEPS